MVMFEPLLPHKTAIVLCYGQSVVLSFLPSEICDDRVVSECFVSYKYGFYASV